MSCGVGCRLGLDPTLLGLWHSLAATALIRPLAQKLPYATGDSYKEEKNSHHPQLSDDNDSIELYLSSALLGNSEG